MDNFLPDSNVNHPSHYTSGTIECIDAMEAFMSRDHFISHCLANSFKYIWRNNKKGDRIENLKKAQWYLNRAVSTLEIK